MSCGKCKEDISANSDCVTCAVCAIKFHFACSIRETKWRNWSEDVKARWACVNCKSESNLPQKNVTCAGVSDSDGGITTMQEETTKTLLLKMNARLDKLDDVKNAVDGMSASLEFLSNRYDELLGEVKCYRDETKDLRKEVGHLKSECAKKDEELKLLTNRFNVLEQYGRGVNLEIHGLAETPYESSGNILEKTARALGVSFQPNMVQAAHWVPSRNKSRPPMFLVQFVNKATKQQWLVEGRRKKLRSRDIVGEGEGRVFFNENLTPFFSRLFAETRKVAKEKGYQQQFVLNNFIRVKKSYDSRQTHIITCYEDLNRLV